MPALQQAGAAITGYQVVRIARQGHGQQKRVIRIIGFDLDLARACDEVLGLGPHA